jgi:transposase
LAIEGKSWEAMNKPLPPIAESPAYLQTLLRAETDPKKRSRLQALYLLASGQAPSRLVLAKLLAVHRHTIQSWLRRYEEGGLSALLTLKKAPGKPPSLTPTVLSKLQARLAQVQGFGSYGEIQQYLACTHQVALAYSTVHRLVRYKLKAKLKAPRRSHPKKSPRMPYSSRRRSARSSKRA